MPRILVRLDGSVVKELTLSKLRTSIGRRPSSDIMLDSLAVSGEHAVLQLSGNEVYVEDLSSTNGTYVNGKLAKERQLQNGDVVEIGRFKLEYIDEMSGQGFEQTMSMGLKDAPVVTKHEVAPVRAESWFKKLFKRK